MSKPHLHLDFETKSDLDLKKVNADVYSRHPSTRVLMMSYAFGNEPVKIWYPHQGPMPKRVMDALDNPDIIKIAHNAAFELAIFLNTLEIDTPVEQWQCTMVMALSLGLPGQLEQLARDALRLPKIFHKDPEGDKLMRLFSFPSSKATHLTHPAEFERYGGYCVQDTVVERKVYSILIKYTRTYMDRMFRAWHLDRKINARGLPVDLKFIRCAKAMAARAKAEFKDILIEKTGLANPNSTAQMLGWLKERGYPFSSLGKNRVAIAMKDFADEITDEAKEVMTLRLQSNKTSTSKYDALLRASYAGWLRNTFQLYGAAATGRYAGRILGQNMPRPWKGAEEHLASIRKMILAEDYEGLVAFFGQPLECVVSSIRSAIRPPKGKVLLVADLSSIELVVIAWLTRCRFWLNVLAQGKDAYKAFAEQWLQVPYEQVEKWMRTLSKPPALGCGYRMGAGREVGTYPDTEKTGLWGYAANMQVEMTKQQCKDAVRIYRDLSPEICDAWVELEQAAMKCVVSKTPQTTVGGIRFDYVQPFLRMHLPSGRMIHYCRPRIEKVRMEYEDGKTGELKVEWKVGLTYERLSQTSNQWVRRANHGGRYIEQATQGIAYDVLQLGIENAEEDGMPVHGHYHDEILAVVDEDSGLDHTDLIASMCRKAPWMTDMMVKAAGYTGDFYRKD